MKIVYESVSDSIRKVVERAEKQGRAIERIELSEDESTGFRLELLSEGCGGWILGREEKVFFADVWVVLS